MNPGLSKKPLGNPPGPMLSEPDVDKWPFPGLDHYEIGFVRANTALARNPALRILSVLINHIGNGWIIPLVVVVLLYKLGYGAVPVLGIALLCVGIAHIVYPVLKRALARPRPIDIDNGLESLLPPLDRYSCPSGHSMTAMALFIPIVLTVPNSILTCSVAWTLIAWARLVTAHHYASDLLLGGLLGAAVAWPIAAALL